MKVAKSTADVCVVGAGPAGLVAALELGRAGRSVVLLESGGFKPSREAQRLNDGDHEGVTYSGLIKTRHRQIAGTVNTWNTRVLGKSGAKYVALSPRDLADWPITWAELLPYYARAQSVCGLGAFEYGAEHWTAQTRRPFDLAGTGLTTGVYQFGLASRFTHDLPDELRQVRCVTIRSDATVVRLVLDRDARRVQGVEVADASGRRSRVGARSVVLACGAVENARLLLMTGLGGPKGLGWLGHGFMEHPRDYSLSVVPASLDIFANASFYDLHPSRSGTLIAGRLMLTDEAMAAYNLPNASLSVFARPRAVTRRGLVHRLVRSIHRAIGVSWQGGYGWSAVREPTRAFDAINLVLNMEQRPSQVNRIELGARRDFYGNPLPQLVLNWTAEEQAELERFRELLAQWLRVAGIGRLQATKGLPPDLSAHHHAGTTRMGTSPRESVVDLQGRVHGLDNLYLAGASVFPSAGFANPMLTIVAMALRLASDVDAALP